MIGDSLSRKKMEGVVRKMAGEFALCARNVFCDRSPFSSQPTMELPTWSTHHAFTCNSFCP